MAGERGGGVGAGWVGGWWDVRAAGRAGGAGGGGQAEGDGRGIVGLDSLPTHCAELKGCTGLRVGVEWAGAHAC